MANPIASKVEVELPRDESSNCFTSLTIQIITALAVGIVVGAGAATATYFLTQHVILWTAVAGGGSFVLAGTITFVVLRCCCGKSEPQVSVDKGKITLPDSDSDSEPPVPETGKPSQPIDPTGTSSKSENPASTPIQGVSLIGIPYTVKSTVAVDRQSLPDLIRTVDENFPKTMRASGTVYYDPTNELPIPLARLYQEMLTHPTCGDKRDVLLTLLATELLTICVTSLAYVSRYLYSFDPKTLRELATKVPQGFPQTRTLQNELDSYANEEGDRLARAKQRSEVVRQLNEQLGIDHYYLGVSLADGGCLYHTMAQLLSAHFETTITEKTLRMQCFKYTEHQKNTVYKKMSGEEQLSSRNLVETDGEAPTWGDTEIQAQIISNLYGVEFINHEAFLGEQEEVAPRLEEINESTGQMETIRPAIYRETIIPSDGTPIRPQLKDQIKLNDLGYQDFPNKRGILRIASMQSHFYPIWTHQPKT